MRALLPPRVADVPARSASAMRIQAASGFLRIEGWPGLSGVWVRGKARASRRELLDGIRLIDYRDVRGAVRIPVDN